MELPGHIHGIELHLAQLPREYHLAKDTKPLRMTYYDKNIELYKTNEHIVPSETYLRLAARQLMQDPRFRILHLSEQDAMELAYQEWRTNMTRCVYQARLNPYEIQDGPVVVRSKTGVIRVQLQLEPNQVVDEMAVSPRRAKSPKKRHDNLILLTNNKIVHSGFLANKNPKGIMLARQVLSRAMAGGKLQRTFFRSSIVLNEKKEEGEAATATEGATATEETPAAPEDPVAALQAEVADLKAKNAELTDKVLRALADAENVRRISRVDVNNAREFSISKFAKSLLDVSDNLKRAHESISIEELHPEHSMAAIKSLHEGVVMTDKELQKVFHSYGIAQVGEAGDKFDPNFHEALFEYVDDSKTPGTVGQVMKVGYTIHNRVLRPAQVGIVKAGTPSS
ncbi:hypothetical protein Ae201684_004423 [Aphanomyces euteiches]|uniref:GrpE protein homolog n=1 Tax=Aphanomyces euteiches TaxID=100861 RepID=A0A6G0XIT5_9STRA|nr:hypothetical protein Ae201684_004423 [Aphanomyces euteiches]